MQKLLSLIFFLMIPFILNGQDREVVFENYSVNNKPVPVQDTIVIESNDTLTFNYRLDAGEAKERDAFLFRIVLKENNDSSLQNTGMTRATYSNLRESEYVFEISAFDLDGSWTTAEKKVYVIVDNREAKLLSSYNNLLKKSNRQDSIIKSLKKDAPQKGIFNLSNNLIYVLGGLALVLLAALVIVIIRSRKKEPKNNEDFLGKDDKTAKNGSAAEIERLENDNGNLRAELAALRGQIDALQDRSEELRKQNNDLKINLEKINNKKAELENLQEQKDDLFALIIHDIKNPVSLIKSLVELLRSYDLSANEQHDIIDDISSTTLKIVELSHEVSKILAIESNKMELNYDIVDYKQIINDVYNRNKIAAENKKIELFTELNDNLPEVEIDTFKVDEIVDNLVSNAIKFTQNGGMVRIKVYEQQGHIITEVNDNGLGLSEEDIKKAFQRGKQLSAKPTGDESSTGLGLCIVKKLVEAHHGRVWIQSSLGKGSTFYFSLPVKKAEEDEL